MGLKSVKRLNFLKVTYVECIGPKDNNYYLCENRLDCTRFNKWNDNKGGVHNKQGKVWDKLKDEEIKLIEKT